MDMKAISAEYSRETALELAVNAGIDIILMANNQVYDQDIAIRTQEMILGLITTKRISADRINHAQRVMNLKKTKLALSAT